LSSTCVVIISNAGIIIVYLQVRAVLPLRRSNLCLYG